jgi:hypothetical protein
MRRRLREWSTAQTMIAAEQRVSVRAEPQEQ